MIQIDTAVGAAGALALSAAAYASVRHLQRARRIKRTEARLSDLAGIPAGLDVSPVEVVPAQRMEAAPAPLVLVDPALAGPCRPGPAPEPIGPDPARPVVRVRRVVPAGKPKTVRPSAPVLSQASAAVLPEGCAELLPLIETMQWARAFDWLSRREEKGGDLSAIAAIAETAAIERLRALPESDLRTSLAALRVLSALSPSNHLYAERLAQAQAALERRRTALLGRLTRDEDRWEPGTIWFNHPYNPAFDDVRLPIWLYIGRQQDGQIWLRLRTNWLGDTRISVQGIDAVHDRMTETLTDGRYKIDADALGWEWRDETVTPYQLEVLRSLVAAEGVSLRYKGDPYTIEVDLSPEEVRAVADMIELYDLMRADPTLLAPAMAA